MSSVLSARLVDQFFRTDVAAFTNSLTRFETMIDTSALPTRDKHYHLLLQMLDQIRAACKQLEASIGQDEVVLRETQQRFQDAIEPWFEKSWMMNHARTKPQGYAGDYHMLTAIYERQPKSAGLGGYLDLFFMETELGRAVPARKEALQYFLTNEFASRGKNIRVLNVACGPCREFVDGVDVPPQTTVDLTLVDYDEDALAFAEDTLPGNTASLSFNFVRYNALRMQAPKRFIDQYGQFDIVYSVGLCDYLNDRQLIGMLRGWRAMLAESGVLYVAFKDMHRYDKTDYQWLVDWFFLERELKDCQQLFLDAGYSPSEISVTRDTTGIILNFAARAEQFSRIDPSHNGVGAPAKIKTTIMQNVPKQS